MYVCTYICTAHKEHVHSTDTYKYGRYYKLHTTIVPTVQTCEIHIAGADLYSKLQQQAVWELLGQLVDHIPPCRVSNHLLKPRGSLMGNSFKVTYEHTYVH